MEALLPNPEQVYRLPGTAILRWSPIIWGTLHGLSFLYPTFDMCPFLQVLSKSMPCMICTVHLSHYIQKNPPVSGESSVPFYWFDYLVGLHNDVNRRNRQKVWNGRDIRDSYRRIQVQDPFHFQQSIHDRAWQTIWIVLASSDVSASSGGPIAEVAEIYGLVHQVQQVSRSTDIYLPPGDSLDGTLPLTRQCITSLIEKWVASTTPEQVPVPIRWWTTHVSRYRQIHIYADRIIESITSGVEIIDRPMLVLAFLEDLLGIRGVVRLSESPLDQKTWHFLGSMTTLRAVLAQHPVPRPYRHTEGFQTAPGNTKGVLVWTTIGILVLVVLVYLVWSTQTMQPNSRKTHAPEFRSIIS